MRIGIVIPKPPAYSETFFKNKIIGLKKCGFEVILFVNKRDRHFDLCPSFRAPQIVRSPILCSICAIGSLLLLISSRPQNVAKFIDLERKQGIAYNTIIKKLILNAHILRQKLDWLHFGFGTMALGRENLAEAMGAKMAVSLRGFDIAIYPLKHPGCYQLMWSRLDKLHVISDDLEALAIKEGFQPNRRVEKITPAIDVLQFQRHVASKTILGNPLKLLTVARLHWKKGIDSTLEALFFLKEKGIDFNYTIIGDGEDFERLVLTAHQFGIREQINFIGKQSPSVIKQAMEQCDFYLQYSLSEGFCNAVLEAQAMGCLCVVSDAEGLPENVLHGITGWVVPKRNPQALAECLISIMTYTTEDLKAISNRAQKRVLNEYNLEKQIILFEKFYKS